MNTESLLAKTKQFIDSAKVLAEIGDLDSSASRLYYAMFYMASILLDRIGLAYSSHQGVVAAYGKHFAKTQELDPRFHRILISAFEMRQLGDYSAPSGITKEQVTILTQEATAFFAATSHWLATHPPNVD